MTQQRSDLYLELIDKLMRCPNGEEPQVLDAHPDLLDAGFVSMLVQVSTILAHQDNQDGAKFLVHIARQLAQQLGLYPQLSTQEAVAAED